MRITILQFAILMGKGQSLTLPILKFIILAIHIRVYSYVHIVSDMPSENDANYDSRQRKVIVVMRETTAYFL
jgi:hypothetical protein